MSTTLTTVAKRLTVINDILQPDDPYLDVNPLSGRAGKDQKGNLFVFVETQGPGAAGTRRSLSDMIAQTYLKDQSASITSRLTRTIREASTLVTAAQAPGRHRSNTGLSCLVIREDDCYVAQAGPAFTLIAHRAESYMSAGVDVFTEPDVLGIELDPNPDVRLYHTQVKVGDLLIMGSAALGCLSDARGAATSLRGKSVAQAKQILYDLWLAAGGHGDLEALLIEVTDERDLEYVPSYESPRRSQTREPGQNTRQRGFGGRQAKPRGMQSDEEDQWLPPDQPNRHKGQSELPGDKLVNLVGGAGDSFKSGLRHQARAHQARINRIVTFALVAAIVLGAAYFGTRWWQTQQTQTTILNTIDDAENREREAQTATDPAVKRRLLLEAQGIVLNAEEIDRTDRNIMAIKQRLQGELDALGEVARIPVAAKLVNLDAFRASSEPSALLQASDHLFVLDPPAQMLFHFDLKDNGKSVGPSPTPAVVRRNDVVGSTKVSGLVAAAWIPAGGQREQASLVCLDDKGALYAYDPPKGLTLLSMQDLKLSGQAPLLGGYAGNLYVLDAATNRLVWLPPTATGYDRIVYNYLSAGQTADVTTAVAMAVDSNIYVLSKNGAISRFYGGKTQTFDLATPDVPLKQPNALVVGEETKTLYVLDSGNERVVAFSADGHFRRQIRSTGTENPFRNATSLAVDEGKNRLYILSGKIVYSIELE